MLLVLLNLFRDTDLLPGGALSLSVLCIVQMMFRYVRFWWVDLQLWSVTPGVGIVVGDMVNNIKQI